MFCFVGAGACCMFEINSKHDGKLNLKLKCLKSSSTHLCKSGLKVSMICSGFFRSFLHLGKTIPFNSHFPQSAWPPLPPSPLEISPHDICVFGLFTMVAHQKQSLPLKHLFRINASELIFRRCTQPGRLERRESSNKWRKRDRESDSITEAHQLETSRGLFELLSHHDLK